MLGVDKYTWVTVANGSECKIFSVNSKNKTLQLLKGFYSASSHLQAVNLGAEKPGRVHESGNATRHTIEPKLDLHYKEKIKFSELIADYLNKEMSAKNFHHLVLIASPEFLGEIRKRLNKHVVSVIIKEINKDLTNTKEEKILEALC